MAKVKKTETVRMTGKGKWFCPKCNTRDLLAGFCKCGTMRRFAGKP